MDLIAHIQGMIVRHILTTYPDATMKSSGHRFRAYIDNTTHEIPHENTIVGCQFTDSSAHCHGHKPKQDLIVDYTDPDIIDKIEEFIKTSYNSI